MPTPAQDGEPARRNKAIDHMVYDAVVVRREWPGTVDPSTLAQTLRPWSLAGQYRTWNSVQRPDLACLQFEDFLRIQAPDAQRALAIIDATCVDFWADHPVAAQTAKALVGKHYQIREFIAEADANIERLAASDNAAVRQDARMYTTAIAPRTRP